MHKPKKHTGRVDKIERISSKDIKITISLNENFKFIAGQFINVEVSTGKYRSYSIANKHSPTNSLELIVAISRKGIGVNYFKNLSAESKITLIGPSGKFRLQYPLHENIYFFSTGVGFVPFIPMLYELTNSNFNGNIFLYQGVRHIDEIYFNPYIKYLKHNLSSFDCNICVSQPKKSLSNEFCKGRITEAIQLLDLDKNGQFYICGNPEMVNEVKLTLESKNIKRTSIFTEPY